MVNVERGFKRIVWIVCILGLIVFVVGSVLASLFAGKMAEVRADPEFRALDVANQEYVRQRLLWERYPGWPLMITGGLIATLPWGLFYLLRWIVKGFVGHKGDPGV